MSEPTIPDPLHPCASVTVVVHGIGDHSPLDIRTEARKGLCIAGLDNAQIKDIDIPDLTTARDVNEIYARGGPVPGIKAEIDGKLHVLIPVVWSGLRFRAASWAGKLGAVGGLQSVMVAVPALFLLWWDVVRCVPRGRGAWKLPLALVALLVLALVVAYVAGMFWLTVRISMSVTSDSWANTLARTFVLLAGILAIDFSLWMFSGVLDLAGDVAHYIGSDEAREEAAGQLRKILLEVASRAPDARIVILAHSLGSVLASQAVAQAPAIAPGRLILLTCGSPLRLLSRVFPRQIRTPAELASVLSEEPFAASWWNLWRSQDIIGKGLQAGGGPRFKETTLGAGQHPNYWSDERLWTAVAFLLLLPEHEGRILDRPWDSIPLTPDESVELRQREGIAGAAKSAAWGLVLLYWLVSPRTVFAPPWPMHHAAWSKWLVRIASMITMGLFAVAGWPDRTLKPPQVSPRSCLWTLRSRAPRPLLLILLAGAVWGLMAFVDWKARRGIPGPR